MSFRSRGSGGLVAFGGEGQWTLGAALRVGRMPWWMGRRDWHVALIPVRFMGGVSWVVVMLLERLVVDIAGRLGSEARMAFR